MEDKMIEMSVGDRLSLGSVLPRQGNFISLMVAEDLRKELRLSEAEMEEVRMVVGPGEFIGAKGEKINVPDGDLRWDVALEKKKKITLGPKAFDLVYKTLNDLDAHSQLTPDFFALYKVVVLPVREAEELEKSKLNK